MSKTSNLALSSQATIRATWTARWFWRLTRMRFVFLSREEVLSWRFVGPLVKHANTVILPSKQHKTTLKFLSEKLKQGEHFCIFPEGELSKNGQFSDFKDGVAFLQQKSGVPIIPFAIHGGFEAWPEGQRWPKFRKITLAFGKAIMPGETRQQTTQALQQSIQQLKSHLEGLELLETYERRAASKYGSNPRERLMEALVSDALLPAAIQYL